MPIFAFAQRHELAGMRLDEIDRDRRIWVIPDSRTKNHQSHAVPLSDLAIELIGMALTKRTDESEFVFPSPRDNDKPIKPGSAFQHSELMPTYSLLICCSAFLF